MTPPPRFASSLVVERRIDLGDFLGLDRVPRLAVAGTVAAVRRRLTAEVDPEILEREPLAFAGADLLDEAIRPEPLLDLQPSAERTA